METMTALLRSSAEGRRIELTTSAQPAVSVPLTAAEDGVAGQRLLDADDWKMPFVEVSR
jgi:hypothetical protein